MELNLNLVINLEDARHRSALRGMLDAFSSVDELCPPILKLTPSQEDHVDSLKGLYAVGKHAETATEQKPIVASIPNSIDMVKNEAMPRTTGRKSAAQKKAEKDEKERKEREAIEAKARELLSRQANNQEAARQELINAQQAAEHPIPPISPVFTPPVQQPTPQVQSDPDFTQYTDANLSALFSARHMDPRFTETIDKLLVSINVKHPLELEDTMRRSLYGWLLRLT